MVMQETRLPVYVPVKGRTPYELIDPGSGIVGSNAGAWLARKHNDPTLPQTSSALTIDFEGNRFGAANIVTFADRVEHAAGRHIAQYPTVARLVVATDDVTQVGTYDYDKGRVELRDLLADKVSLCVWLGVDEDALADELLCTAERAASRR